MSDVSVIELSMHPHLLGWFSGYSTCTLLLLSFLKQLVVSCSFIFVLIIPTSFNFDLKFLLILIILFMLSYAASREG